MGLFCGWIHVEHLQQKVDPSQWYLPERWRHVPRFLFRQELRLDDQCPRLPFHVLNHRLIPWQWSERHHHQVQELLQERLLIFVGHFYRLQVHYWSQEVYLLRKRQRQRRDLRPEKFCLNSCHSPILTNFYCLTISFFCIKNCIRHLFKSTRTSNDFSNFLSNRSLTSTVVLNR